MNQQTPEQMEAPIGSDAEEQNWPDLSPHRLPSCIAETDCSPCSEDFDELPADAADVGDGRSLRGRSSAGGPVKGKDNSDLNVLLYSLKAKRTAPKRSR